MIKNALNQKEYKVLTIIRAAEEPITSVEIQRQEAELSKNIIQSSLRKLLSLGLVEVYDTILEKNILSRRFVLAEDAPRILQEMFREDFTYFEALISRQELFAALIETPEDSIRLAKDLRSLLKHADKEEKDV